MRPSAMNKQMGRLGSDLSHALCASKEEQEEEEEQEAAATGACDAELVAQREPKYGTDGLRGYMLALLTCNSYRRANHSKHQKRTHITQLICVLILVCLSSDGRFGGMLKVYEAA
jgi:hypothetical protein